MVHAAGRFCGVSHRGLSAARAAAAACCSSTCLRMAFIAVRGMVNMRDDCSRDHSDNSLIYMECPLFHGRVADPGTGISSKGHKLVAVSSMMQWHRYDVIHESMRSNADSMPMPTASCPS